MIKKGALLSQVAYATQKPGSTSTIVCQQKMNWWPFGSCGCNTKTPQQMDIDEKQEDENQDQKQDFQINLGEEQDFGSGSGPSSGSGPDFGSGSGPGPDSDSGPDFGSGSGSTNEKSKENGPIQSTLKIIYPYSEDDDIYYEDRYEPDTHNEEIIIQSDRWDNEWKQFRPIPEETLEGQFLHKKLLQIGVPLFERKAWLAPEITNILDKIALVKKIDEDGGKPEVTLYYDGGKNGGQIEFKADLHDALHDGTYRVMNFPREAHRIIGREQCTYLYSMEFEELYGCDIYFHGIHINFPWNLQVRF